MNKISKAFLWLYPLLFLLDATLSLVDDITSYFFVVKLLSFLRNQLATSVYFLSVPYIFNLFLYKTKKPLFYWLPPLYNVIFTVLSALNFISLINSSSLFSAIAFSISPHYIYSKHFSFFFFNLLSTITQVVVAFYCFRYVWKNKNDIERKKLKFMKASAVSSSFLVLFLIVNIFTIVAMFASASHGFIKIRHGAITGVEKVIEKNGKIVHLVPMIHVGSKDFYKEFSALEVPKKTLFLLEGVKDVKNLVGPISYRKMATTLGLSSQEENFRPQAKTNEFQKNLSYIVADMDVSEFSPETRKFLNKMTKDLNDKSFFELLLLGHDNEGLPDDVSFLFVDILERRNQKLLHELSKNESDFEEFYIPWGAAHLPDIERELLSSGYKLVSEKEREIISLMKAAQ